MEPNLPESNKHAELSRWCIGEANLPESNKHVELSRWCIGEAESYLRAG